MKITLKLYAALGQYLPQDAVKNEAEVEVEDSLSVGKLLENQGVPAEHCHLVLVNGNYVAPSERNEKDLKEGDALAVWPPVAGG